MSSSSSDSPFWEVFFLWIVDGLSISTSSMYHLAAKGSGLAVIFSVMMWFALYQAGITIFTHMAVKFVFAVGRCVRWTVRELYAAIEKDRPAQIAIFVMGFMSALVYRAYRDRSVLKLIELPT
jgi:hypothetical protein